MNALINKSKADNMNNSLRVFQWLLFGNMFLAFLLISPKAGAQGDLPTSEVEVIKRFEARLIESERIEIRPGQVAVDPLPQNYQYEVLEHTEPVAYDAPEIKPRGYRAPAAPASYRGFLKAGAGWPLNYLGQAGYQWNMDRDMQANIRAGFRGLNDGQVEDRQVLNGNLDADLNYFSPAGVKLSGSAGYRKDLYHYYNPVGEVDSTEANKVDYNDIYIGAALQNYQVNSLGIDYRVSLEGKFMNNNYAQKNNTFNLSGEVGKRFGEHMNLSIGLGSYNDTYNDFNKYKQNYFSFNPTLAYASERFQVKGGIILLSSGGSPGLKPDAEVEVGIIPNLIHVYAGATGAYKINNMRTFMNENPFLAHEFSDTLRLSDINHYYGGFKGNLSGISYTLQGGFRNIDHMPVFQISEVVDSLSPGYILYSPVFDRAKNIYGELSVSMPLLDHLNIYTTVRYDHYKMEELEKPYYIPSTKVQLGGKYSMLDGRLSLGMDFNFLSMVDYPDNELKKPNAVFDINLNGEYLFTDTFGAFIEFNNLADSRYIRWQNYEGLGLNVLGGISMRLR